MDAGPLGGGRSRTGWITFAGAYLLVAGAMNAIWGLAAVTDREVLREGALQAQRPAGRVGDEARGGGMLRKMCGHGFRSFR